MSQTTSPAPGWRIRAGLIFFILTFVCPALVPLVAFTDLPTEWKATISGLLLLGIPEVLTLAAIALLGKQGFDHLVKKALALLRRYGPPQKVSRARYYIGLTILFLQVVYGSLVFYAPEFIPGYAGNRIAMNLAADVIFVASFFVLGGEFWDKFRALFIYDAKAQIPERKSA